MSAEAYLDPVLSIWAERHERTTSKLSGNSMAPLLWHGDVLQIEHGNESLRVGDILVFRGSGRLLAHRLICRKQMGGREFLIAKGDHCSTYDLPITSDEVVGKVIEVTGSSGHMRLSNRSWIVANYLLAGLSRVSARSGALGSTLWGAVRLVRRLHLTITRESSGGSLARARSGMQSPEKHAASEDTLGWRRH